MESHLLNYFRSTYERIRILKRIWVQDHNSLWYQLYSNNAHELFLQRFDESMQVLIAPPKRGSIEAAVDRLNK